MRRTGNPVFKGHAVVVMQDGTEVHLEPSWAPEAIRPAREIERFDGRLVKVTGTVHVTGPEPPEPSAHLVAPTIRPVEAIEEFDGEDSGP
jgi:hypothetical protein